MNIHIIFPPVSDPRGPHLAPAALAAALRRAGHSIKLRDLDLELALYLLQPEVFNEHLQKAKALFQTLDIKCAVRLEEPGLAAEEGQCIAEAEAGILKMPGHLDNLRGEVFYDHRKYYAARRMRQGAGPCLLLL